MTLLGTGERRIGGMNNLEGYYLTRTYNLFRDCLNILAQEEVRPKMEHALNELKLIIEMGGQKVAESESLRA